MSFACINVNQSHPKLNNQSQIWVNFWQGAKLAWAALIRLKWGGQVKGGQMGFACGFSEGVLAETTAVFLFHFRKGQQEQECARFNPETTDENATVNQS